MSSEQPSSEGQLANFFEQSEERLRGLIESTSDPSLLTRIQEEVALELHKLGIPVEKKNEDWVSIDGNTKQPLPVVQKYRRLLKLTAQKSRELETN